ncbi:hypothetical protein [Moorena bouillonii]|uniref:hypothetical protein n=1 Tax=Moorena bouillonii TaxID=207920 RepID=UPI0011807321|nr:hypothetical protein [Moorena bouillonii]
MKRCKHSSHVRLNTYTLAESKAEGSYAEGRSKGVRFNRRWFFITNYPNMILVSVLSFNVDGIGNHGSTYPES